jgi:probable addiction module antidote protein
MSVMTGAGARPYDTAEFLNTPGRVAAYLNLAAESGDAKRIANAIGTVIRAGNVSDLARKTGFTREGLSKAFSDKGNPSLEMILKVMSALGHRVAFPALGDEAPARNAKRPVKRSRTADVTEPA